MTGTMKTLQVDVAVIGSGTAGMTAHKAARMQGKRVLMIESGPYGTTCARVGCMPSKLLIAAAEAAHQARHTEPFGVQVQGITIDGAAVMARVRRERDRFVGFVLDTVKTMPQGDRLRSQVRFQDATTLVTQDGQLIHAKRI